MTRTAAGFVVELLVLEIKDGSCRGLPDQNKQGGRLTLIDSCATQADSTLTCTWENKRIYLFSSCESVENPEQALGSSGSVPLLLKPKATSLTVQCVPPFLDLRI